MRDGEEKIRKRGGLLLEELAEDQLRRGIGTEEITASRRTQWDRAKSDTRRREREVGDEGKEKLATSREKME
ncbi:hypothetical protein F2Q69_00029610 [Brassica cretica]|uniref:Uncharacterized protein n=1 Tax=Brassica cretica TaxID=69181 RepID=A0A8S9S280_BRACR|nr:hypothetical protein F2Q69_00029610 [Brassica cretica]